MRTERIAGRPFFPVESDAEPVRVVDRTSIAAFERTSGLPPVQDETAEAWSRVERSHPNVASTVPESARTPAAKLLYVIAHRELSKQTGPLSVEVGGGDTVRRTASGSIELRVAGRAPVVLNDHHGDFAKLLTAGVFEALGSGVEALLSTAVRAFYADPSFTGGGEAASERGGRAFRYSTFTQVLVSDNPAQRGLECLGSAAFHLWMSMGLIPPDLTREELERRYTEIHDGPAPVGVHLAAEFTRSLRGGPARNPGERRLDAAATVEFANRLRETDWAKLTGSAVGRYSVRALRSTDELVAHFENGGGGVRTTWADGGHYFVLTGARRENGVVTVDQDDSLWKTPAQRSASNPRPNVRRYDEATHTRFWTLERSP